MKAIRSAALGLGALVAVTATAAEPMPRQLDQFIHTAWSTRDGALSDVRFIDQSDDGYLWLGTVDKVQRFDGSSFEAITSLHGRPLAREPFQPSDARDGSLLAVEGGVYYRNGEVRDVGAVDPRNFKQHAYGLDGEAWVIDKGVLKRIEHGVAVATGAEWHTPTTASELYVDSRGGLWVTTRQDPNAYYLPRGARVFEVNTDDLPNVTAEAPDGSMWFSSPRGIQMISMEGSKRAGHRYLTKTPCDKLLFDRWGGLWVITSKGVSHLADWRQLLQPHPDDLLEQEMMGLAAGLSSDVVWTLFEDRDGDIWTGTANGFDRFRRPLITPVRLPRRSLGFAVAPASNGAIWAGNWSGSLMRTDGRDIRDIPEVPKNIGVMALDSQGRLWASSGQQLFHEQTSGRFKQVEQDFVDAQFPFAMAVGGDGDLWIAGIREGDHVRRLHDGVWVDPFRGSGFEEERGALMLFHDSHDRIWISRFLGNLLIFDNGKFSVARASSSSDDLGRVIAMFERGDHLWLAGTGGIALFDNGTIRPVHDVNGKPFGTTRGIVETASGDVWLQNVDHATRIAASDLRSAVDQPDVRVRADRFDSEDGLIGNSAIVNPFPSLVEGTDGRIWFGTNAAVAWVDPATVAAVVRAPTLQIRSLMADGQPVDVSSEKITVPAQSEHIEVAYTAIEPAKPETIQFRYRLTGFDTDWQPAGTRRTAFYTNLSPGRYRFELQSTDQRGHWTEQTAAVGFVLAAAWWQTLPFRIACGLSGLLLIWLIYRVRIAQMKQRMDDKMHVRLAERESIARTLHDTLLQSVQGLIFYAQAVVDPLARTDPTRVRFEQLLGMADAAVGEARSHVQGLRDHSGEGGDLLTQLRQLVESNASVELPVRMTVRGRRRQTRSDVTHELVAVVAEALSNAIRHAKAKSVQVTVRFHWYGLRIRIEDDGVGIDPAVIKGGVAGHWGLVGMRERAESLGASIDIGAGGGGGTQVSIRIGAIRGYGFRSI